MIQFYDSFKDGIEDEYPLENVPEDIREYIPNYLTGKVFFVEDTYEGHPNMEKIEETFDKFESNLKIIFVDLNSCEVEIKYNFLSHFAFYKFINNVSGLSFGMKTVR